MRLVCLLALLVAVCSSPLSAPESDDISRIDRIEKDVSLLSGLLRQLLVDDESPETVNSKSVHKLSGSVQKVQVQTRQDYTQSPAPVYPLDKTIDFFPADVFKGESEQYGQNSTGQSLYIGNMPEAEGVSSKALPNRNRDAITCPGYPEECSGHGMCDEGVCHCDNLWTLADCSELNCFPTCVYEHGYCRNGTCECIPGWTGSGCEVADCYPACIESNGHCDAGICVCNPGFEGRSCELKMCPNRCTNSERGSCNPVSGECECLPGWGGEDCSLVSFPCAYTCLNGGSCKNGTCDCTDEYEGPDCGQMKPPVFKCEGGSVWTDKASPYVKTCENTHGDAFSDAPIRSVSRCACPPQAPIWDTESRQCVTEEFCVIGDCGEMPTPGPNDIVVAVRTKPTCDWTNGDLPCVDGSANVTICFKAGFFVARQISVAKDVSISLFRVGSSCGHHETLKTFASTISPIVEVENSTTISDESASISITKITTFEYPDLSNFANILLEPKDRKSVGSATIHLDCLGVYEPRVIVVSSLMETEIMGSGRIIAENATCPGSPPCSSAGACIPGFRKSHCKCAPDHLGVDCSASRVDDVTVLPGNITTVLPIPPDAQITYSNDSVVVVTDNIEYVFFPNGTVEIHTEQGTTVTQSQPESDHGCTENTSWRSCSIGCFPTCRNPNPRCTPTCLYGSCHCPDHLPLYDEIQKKCVAHNLCSSQVPCPGVGAVCSNKGTCVNGTCECAEGYGAEDCSVATNLVPRVTTASGTVQSVRVCAFPFEFRGKTYTDCTTDYDSEGKEWCSNTHEWEHQWGYCAPRGACPSTDGIECNGRGICVSGVCHCDDLWSGEGCTHEYIRYDSASFRRCHLPFIGPDSAEHLDCMPGIPEDREGKIFVKSGGKDDFWCLTTFRYEGPQSLAMCQPAGLCGNCSSTGGVCVPANTGKCECHPGFEGEFCDKVMDEREILIKLYVSTDGENWNRKTNWGNIGSPCQEPGWAGITCHDGHVVRINLDSTGLKGTIPEDLAALPHLEILDLSNNGLVGTFPAELIRNPVSLVSISVSGNWLVGSIPPLPSRIIYADFSQNFINSTGKISTTTVPRVTDGTGTVSAYTQCSFPFEYYGQLYYGCTKDWSSTGKPWCSTTPEYSEKWGVCAEIGTCPGTNGVQCSGNGKCVQELSSIGLSGRCECNQGYSGETCGHPVRRVTKTSMVGQREELHGTPCVFPFTYKGKEYKDCTTDGSPTGEAWCMVSSGWERRWGYCAPEGFCPGAKHNCSGHGKCNDGLCECDAGWIWNDCSVRAPRVVTGERTEKGKTCHFPFSVDDIEYHECSIIGGETSSVCATDSGPSLGLDICSPIGTCPGNPQCSGRGDCDQGECICKEGFTGVDCSTQMEEREILVKFFRNTGGQYWLKSTGWEQGSHCTWFGITCNRFNQTVSIDLPSNNLDGVLVGDVALLPALESLNLQGNLLAGSIPTLLERTPNLHIINLESNQFVGSLPNFLPGKVVACNRNCIDSPRCTKGSCSYPF